jgi:hypothetical protein
MNGLGAPTDELQLMSRSSRASLSLFLYHELCVSPGASPCMA